MTVRGIQVTSTNPRKSTFLQKGGVTPSPRVPFEHNTIQMNFFTFKKIAKIQKGCTFSILFHLRRKVCQIPGQSRNRFVGQLNFVGFFYSCFTLKKRGGHYSAAASISSRTQSAPTHASSGLTSNAWTNTTRSTPHALAKKRSNERNRHLPDTSP